MKHINKRTLWSKCRVLNFKAGHIYSYIYHLHHIYFIELSKQITCFFQYYYMLQLASDPFIRC